MGLTIRIYISLNKVRAEVNMIRISQIDGNLNVYKQNKIIIYGAGELGEYICKALQYYNLSPYCFVDKDEKKQGNTILGINVKSPEELFEIFDENTIVQIGTRKDYEEGIVKLLEKHNINRFITYSEARTRLKHMRMRDLICNNKAFMENLTTYRETEIQWGAYLGYDNLMNTCDKELLFICAPQKTGNHSLISTLNENRIMYHNFWHNPASFNKEIYTAQNSMKIKIITAVRDPISQNISSLFEAFKKERPWLLLRKKDFWADGGDVQKLFDYWIKVFGYVGDAVKDKLEMDVTEKYTCGRLIQQFIPEFQNNIVDILKFPFDKELGYSIIKEKNIEVFVYQTEKLNQIFPIMKKWIGNEELSISKVRTTDDSWLKDSYHKAQRELVFSKEYIEKCYDEPFVKHFYSIDDIDGFKRKWMQNVR